MTCSLTAGPHRLTGWNGLQFRHPVNWEVIVAAPRHLIVENNLNPLLEIRWETNGKSSAEQVVQTATTMLAAGDRPVKRLHPGALFHDLDLPGLTALSWHDELSADGLVWQCPVCRTVLFLHLNNRKTDPAILAAFLKSIRCHQEPGKDTLWSIQDVRLTLPPAYTYVDSTFAAGLSRLAFHGLNLRLQFCRLAPATTRLAQDTMAVLLSRMLGSHSRREVITDLPKQYEAQTIPTVVDRLAAKIAGKPVFRWGRIWHEEQQDRLLSLIIESRYPINRTQSHHLAQRYEILSIE